MPMPIEKKESWGITRPSLLASSGTLISFVSAWLWLAHSFGLLLGIFGISLIGFAIRMNLTKDLNVK